MTIKKFVGKTEEAALKKAQDEFGPSCVIMNVRMVKPTGIFRIFKTTLCEVTVAVEEKTDNGPILNHDRTSTDFQATTCLGQVDFKADEEMSLKDISFVSHSKSKYGTDNKKGTATKQGKIIKSQQEIEFEEHTKDTKILEQRIDHLQKMLEERVTDDKKKSDANSIESEIKETKEVTNEKNKACVKAIYNTLLKNEVEEKYINQLLDEMEMVVRTSTSIDRILSTIYQKMILKFGQPKPIEPIGSKPKVIFFIGPTGVGKTTTIAKVASRIKIVDRKEVALLTADTYRIAATEQLKTYASILEAPISVVYSVRELGEEITKVNNYDYVLVDTAGFSHKNDEQREEMKRLVESVDVEYEKEVYLVLSATTKYNDLKDIADAYKGISNNYKLIFTKLDETSCYGNLYNIKSYTGAEMSYVTDGQKVPEDLEVFNTQKTVKKLLGGK